MKYRKKPVEVDADEWMQNGDHPEDKSELMQPKSPEEPDILTEGKIVRRYRHPNVDGQSKCKECEATMHIHGWIDTKEGGHIVCPGDWIITGTVGERYPCKPSIFPTIYEKVED